LFTGIITDIGRITQLEQRGDLRARIGCSYDTGGIDLGSTRVTLQAPETLAKFIAPKGSVALNGTSLTVNEVEGVSFGINFIPHTKSVTNWGDARVGDRINLEIDTLARYVARLQDWA